MKTVEQAAADYGEMQYSFAIEKKAKDICYYLEQAINICETDFKAGVRFAQRWISVEEELPEQNAKCLVRLQNGNVETDTFTTYWFTFGDTVTHWRHIELK